MPKSENHKRLEQAGLMPTQPTTPAEQDLIDNLSKDEVDALISMSKKFTRTDIQKMSGNSMF